MRHRLSPAWYWGGTALVLLLPLLLGSCAGRRSISLPYPSESASFAFVDSLPPRVFLGVVEDKRPPAQRKGQGSFFGITFPRDSAWQRPVDQLYREALAQDLVETRLVELTPLPRQAKYTLSAEIFSLSCRLERSPASFLLPLGAGMMSGMVFGETSSDRLKTGAVIGLGLMMAVPMPAQQRAECEVRLTLRDAAGEVVWQQACLGEVSGRVYLAVTARDDRKLAEKHLPRAVKRCNACLLGQLRQALGPGGQDAAP